MKPRSKKKPLKAVLKGLPILSKVLFPHFVPKPPKLEVRSPKLLPKNLKKPKNLSMKKGVSTKQTKFIANSAKKSPSSSNAVS